MESTTFFAFVVVELFICSIPWNCLFAFFVAAVVVVVLIVFVFIHDGNVVPVRCDLHHNPSILSTIDLLSTRSLSIVCYCDWFDRVIVIIDYDA